jgi:Ulp1 family protease
VDFFKCDYIVVPVHLRRQVFDDSFHSRILTHHSQQSLGFIDYHQPRSNRASCQYLTHVCIIQIQVPWRSLIISHSIIAVFDSLSSRKMAQKIFARLKGWLSQKASQQGDINIRTILAKVIQINTTNCFSLLIIVICWRSLNSLMAMIVGFM